MQYALAIAAIFSVAMVTYSLSIQTYSVSNQYVPIVLIWMCLGIFIHILGAVALRLRVKLVVENPLGISTALKNEFLLSAYHPEGRLAFRQESCWFISLSWATSVATIMHIAMGTLVLSSLLFINVQERVVCGRSYSLSFVQPLESPAEFKPGPLVSRLSLHKQSCRHV